MRHFFARLCIALPLMAPLAHADEAAGTVTPADFRQLATEIRTLSGQLEALRVSQGQIKVGLQDQVESALAKTEAHWSEQVQKHFAELQTDATRQIVAGLKTQAGTEVSAAVQSQVQAAVERAVSASLSAHLPEVRAAAEQAAQAVLATENIRLEQARSEMKASIRNDIAQAADQNRQSQEQIAAARALLKTESDAVEQTATKAQARLSEIADGNGRMIDAKIATNDVAMKGAIGELRAGAAKDRADLLAQVDGKIAASTTATNALALEIKSTSAKDRADLIAQVDGKIAANAAATNALVLEAKSTSAKDRSDLLAQVDSRLNAATANAQGAIDKSVSEVRTSMLATANATARDAAQREAAAAIAVEADRLRKTSDEMQAKMLAEAKTAAGAAAEQAANDSVARAEARLMGEIKTQVDEKAGEIEKNQARANAEREALAAKGTEVALGVVPKAGPAAKPASMTYSIFMSFRSDDEATAAKAKLSKLGIRDQFTAHNDGVYTVYAGAYRTLDEARTAANSARTSTSLPVRIKDTSGQIY